MLARALGAVLMLAVVFVVTVFVEPGPTRTVIQLSGAVLALVLFGAVARHIMWLQQNSGLEPSAGGEVQGQEGATQDSLRAPAGRFEEIDGFGDRYRLMHARRWISIFASSSLIGLLLLAVGDSTLKTAGGIIFALSLIGLVPMVVGFVHARRRIVAGRELLPGDPYRPEGIDPEQRV